MLVIRDETADAVLASRARPVRGLWRQALGLMFRSRLDDEGWVFELPRVSRWDVTNLFVFQAIDVLWLDADRRVLQKRSVPAWTPRVRGVAGTRFLVELPLGAARVVKPGHVVSWRY